MPSERANSNGKHLGLFPHLFMTVEEYGLYTHMRMVARIHENVYKFDGVEVARRFSETGKDAIYRIRLGLEKKGWIILAKPRTRNKGGSWNASEYRIVEAEAWYDTHPRQVSATQKWLNEMKQLQ